MDVDRTPYRPIRMRMMMMSDTKIGTAQRTVVTFAPIIKGMKIDVQPGDTHDRFIALLDEAFAAEEYSIAAATCIETFMRVAASGRSMVLKREGSSDADALVEDVLKRVAQKSPGVVLIADRR